LISTTRWASSDCTSLLSLRLFNDFHLWSYVVHQTGYTRGSSPNKKRDTQEVEDYHRKKQKTNEDDFLSSFMDDEGLTRAQASRLEKQLQVKHSLKTAPSSVSVPITWYEKVLTLDR
jgi:hypothetical protein